MARGWPWTRPLLDRRSVGPTIASALLAGTTYTQLRPLDGLQLLDARAPQELAEVADDHEEHPRHVGRPRPERVALNTSGLIDRLSLFLPSRIRWARVCSPIHWPPGRQVHAKSRNCVTSE